jgi:ATP-binding cassette subfamily C protein CydD
LASASQTDWTVGHLRQEIWNSRAAFGLALGASTAVGFFIVIQAYYVSLVIEQVFLQGASLDEVSGLFWILFLVILGRAALVWVGSVSSSYSAIRIKDDLRRRVYAHILILGPLYTYGERSGELISTMTEGIEDLDEYFSQYLPQLVIAALIPLTLLLFVLRIDVLSAVILLLTAPLIPVFMILIGRAAEALTNRQWDSLRLMSGHFMDVLQGLTTLKRLGQGEAQTANIARVGDQFRASTMVVLRVAFLSALILELLATVSVAIIAVEVGLRLLAGNISFQTALFILILAPEFYQPLRSLAAHYHAGLRGVSAANRIYAILNTPLTTQGLQDQTQDRTQTQNGTVQLPAEISLVGVYYAYGDKRTALQGVSFRIQPNQIVALVGASGSGKSTIVNLLLQFDRPDRGQIKVGGFSLDAMDPDEWRAQIAWVPEAPHLFNMTVMENIRLAKPKATDAEIVTAAKYACAHDSILAMPQGYQTMIGEKGIGMSRGQAQRVALARAFLKDAPLLIMDEPTSNLDPDTENKLQTSIERLMAGRTVLLVAHRRTTIYQVDQIVVVEAGRVVESGRHDELIQLKGHYHRLLAA